MPAMRRASNLHDGRRGKKEAVIFDARDEKRPGPWCAELGAACTVPTSQLKETVASGRTASRWCGSKSRIFSDTSIIFPTRPACSAYRSRFLLKPKDSTVVRDA